MHFDCMFIHDSEKFLVVCSNRDCTRPPSPGGGTPSDSENGEAPPAGFRYIKGVGISLVQFKSHKGVKVREFSQDQEPFMGSCQDPFKRLKI